MPNETRVSSMKPTYDDLVDALHDALDGLEEMICYCTPYFIEKWELDGYITRARATLAWADGDIKP